jgi:hypothetical protein
MQTFTGLAGNAVNVSGGVATVPTGASIVVNGVSTPGNGTIAVSNVTVPGGGASALASNWQNNSSSVPIFSGANTVECSDGSDGGSLPTYCHGAVHFKDGSGNTASVSSWYGGSVTASYLIFTPAHGGVYAGTGNGTCS